MTRIQGARKAPIGNRQLTSNAEDGSKRPSPSGRGGTGLLALLLLVPYSRYAPSSRLVIRPVALATIAHLFMLRSTRTLNAFIRSLRPRQWTKNLLVFSAPLFAGAFDLHSLLITSAALAAFCALSSATYLINDVLDAEQDRHHPVKRFRPLAAGEVSVVQLLAGALLLVIVALGTAALIQPKLLWIFLSYIALQVLYNLKFKELVVLDIMTVATGFVLRAVAGAVAVSVAVSPWFLSSIGLVSLFIAVEKRKSELRRMEANAGNTRKALNLYSLEYLETLGNTAAASSLITYGLWTFQASNTQWMMLTIPVVAYALFRYQYLVWDSHRGESPEDLLLSDHPLLLAIALWVLACVLILALDR